MKNYVVKQVHLEKDEKEKLELIYYSLRQIKFGENLLYTSNFNEEKLKKKLLDLTITTKEIQNTAEFLLKRIDRK